jgi:uncharacterized protein YqhQ
MPEIKHTHIGGQAVLEGIMMRGKFNWAVAVRKADGSIYVEEHDLPHSAARDHAWLRWPIIRGVWAFYETIRLALQAFTVSAEQAGDEDAGEALSSGEVAFTMVLGLVMAVGLFILLPAVLTNLGLSVGHGGLGVWQRLTGSFLSSASKPLVWNVADGILRLAVFFAYIWAVSNVKDIQRVFAYHGAEHEVIHAYEHGDPLDPEHARAYGTLHVRCGTSFLLMVMVVAILVFSIVPAHTLAARLISRILLLPVVAGLAYEITVKWAGNHVDNPLVRVLLWPGLQLQRMTTRPPDDSMIEVAVAAVTPIIQRERVEDAKAAGESLPAEDAEIAEPDPSATLPAEEPGLPEAEADEQLT